MRMEKAQNISTYNCPSKLIVKLGNNNHVQFNFRKKD
jgi:hypothetical protein